MSVTVSEYATAGPNTPTNMQDQPEHKEQLLAGSKPKMCDRMRHTARGFEAIGFNEYASMYSHGFRQNSVESQKREKRKSGGAGEEKERPGRMEKKRTMSFIKKLIGGKEKEKERGERV